LFLIEARYQVWVNGNATAHGPASRATRGLPLDQKNDAGEGPGAYVKPERMTVQAASISRAESEPGG
jgi:hypothetical protein